VTSLPEGLPAATFAGTVKMLKAAMDVQRASTSEPGVALCRDTCSLYLSVPLAKRLAKRKELSR